MAKRTDRSPADERAASTLNIASGAEAPTRQKPGPKPGTEAAKRGGTAAREKYGREFFRRIGAMGGATVRERHGRAFYTAIGQRGGETTKQRLGTEHYSRIGRIGGRSGHGTRSADGEGIT